jgi:hypothetical protein
VATAADEIGRVLRPLIPDVLESLVRKVVGDDKALTAVDRPDAPPTPTGFHARSPSRTEP